MNTSANETHMAEFVKKEVRRKYESKEYEELRKELERRLAITKKTEEERISNISLYISKSTFKEIEKGTAHLNESMNEVLRSGLPITKSLTIPASYKELIKKMNKVENIELNQNFQNTETKLFLNEEPIKMLEPEFVEHHQMNFKTQLLKVTFDADIQKRAEIIAKLEILQKYRTKALLEEEAVQKTRDNLLPEASEIQLDKQESMLPEWQKKANAEKWAREAEQQSELILSGLTTSMNKMCNDFFTLKKYDDATRTKTSLEKLIHTSKNLRSVEKLKFLVRYKAAKGY